MGNTKFTVLKNDRISDQINSLLAVTKTSTRWQGLDADATWLQQRLAKSAAIREEGAVPQAGRVANRFGWLTAWCTRYSGKKNMGGGGL